MKVIILVLVTLCFTTAIHAEEKSTKSSTILGMSVTGNKESPRSLTIVPWRSPLLDGQSPIISPVWQPKLGLLDPDSYRRDINLFLVQRKQIMRTSNQNQ